MKRRILAGGIGSRPHPRITSVGLLLALLTGCSGPGSNADAPAPPLMSSPTSGASQESSPQKSVLAGAAETGTPGAQGGGDPYFPGLGNGGYDVATYRIDNTVDVSPKPRLVNGNTKITATATQDLSRFNLDFALNVDSVRVDGRAAKYRRSGSELVITPQRDIRAGADFTTVVTYHGAGTMNQWYWVNGETMLTGEPRAAQWWFPSNDTPRDEATYTVRLRVPAGKQGVSVGRLVDRRSVAGRTAWTWKSAEPMATYLAFFAVGGYDLKTETVGDVTYTYAVSQKLSAAKRSTNLRLLRLTPKLISALENDYGPYPFADGGGLVTPTLDTEDNAMENQTRPTYPVMKDNTAARRLVVHELAHQWFGDHVRVDAWRDIVDNEGLARWAELRWRELNGGPSADAQLRSMYAAHGRGAAFWKRRIDDPGPGHLFDLAVYDRGGMMVQALRNRVGDAAFFTLLKRWNTLHGGATARTRDFESLAAQVSGQDLAGFFDAWLRRPERPAEKASNGL